MSKNDGIRIRAATREDMATVETMIKKMAVDLKTPYMPKLSSKDLELHGFDTQPPLFHCQIAEQTTETEADSEVVGFAVYHPTYSPWFGPNMFLQDLFVSEGYRRHGVGDRLFNAVAKHAVSAGCGRLDLDALGWTEARFFYQKKGAINMTETLQWNAYRLEGEALRKAAEMAIN